MNAKDLRLLFVSGKNSTRLGRRMIKDIVFKLLVGDIQFGVCTTSTTLAINFFVLYRKIGFGKSTVRAQQHFANEFLQVTGQNLWFVLSTQVS